ncbi:hypothetical protein ACKU27_11135 [Sphingobium yanoikuyae]|uniref:hypothetical protein n=1 Tax=Sphingobium yanoikuyae TaxID=13690 RepID=UPI003B8F1671
MKMPLIRLTDHGSEIALLSAIAVGVVLLLWRAIERGLVGTGFDVAAFLLVLQRIIEAVQGRWTQRSVDRMGQSLANAPPADPPAQGVQS